jgi:3-deoxy-D-manno-octulosonic acid (KDO) 8-phosphate synthase
MTHGLPVITDVHESWQVCSVLLNIINFLALHDLFCHYIANDSYTRAIICNLNMLWHTYF